MREGGCACGQLTYRTESAPIIVHCCLCSYCQRETGSAFAFNYLVEADRVAFEGEREIVDTPSASGKGQRIIRCPECHVAVSSHYQGLGEAAHFLRVGTMTDRSGLRPDAYIYAADKQPWVPLDPDIPTFDAFYNPAEFWSEEVMARIKALRSQSG